jgi:sigma-B regulation protein RsbU (phosphoserine phosphatase)
LSVDGFQDDDVEVPSAMHSSADTSTTVAANEAEASVDILLVDDDDATRELLVDIVERLGGFRARAASGGASALEMHAAAPADVILADWTMPGMDGVELCERVHAKTPQTYFLLVTAHRDEEHMRTGRAAGADEFLLKPVELDQLETRLTRARQIARVRRAGTTKPPPPDALSA